MDNERLFVRRLQEENRLLREEIQRLREAESRALDLALQGIRDHERFVLGVITSGHMLDVAREITDKER